MKFGRFTMRLLCYTIALVLMSVGAGRALAQDSHSHTQELTPDQKKQQGALIKIVQDATERFKYVKEAEYEGYHLKFGCVTGPDKGAMGLHYVNDYLVGTGRIDPKKPQILIYEPTPNGPKLIGADYLVLADGWDTAHPADPPELMGQLFHYFEFPNRFALPAFYTLHVWAWKDNPDGAFVNWHPDVDCKPYVGKTNN